ncbi:MAG: hypothetical protein RL266_496, partial [Bacteroidota bacterium]
NLTGATLTGTTLQIDIEGGSSTSVNLASLVDDGDWTSSGTNIYNANTGNVGIGTPSPNYKVSINDGTSTWLQLTSTASGSTATDGMMIGLTGSNEGRITVRENWPLLFYTNNTQQMRIEADGNVGIGTTATSAKLQVTPTTGVAIMVDRTTGNPNIEAGPTAGGWFIADGNMASNGKAGLNYYSAGDVVLAQGGGNVGVGVAAPLDELHVEGSIRMVDGNQANGYVATSDANGTIAWENPRRGVNFVEQVGTTGIGDNSWVDLAANTARTIDVRNGDIISVWADANIRFQSGSGSDDFEYRVSYSGCATGNMQTKTMRFDEAGGHDNFTPLTYADAMVVSCNGTLTFKYSVRRSSGDDPWEATNGVVIFRKN